MANIPDRFGRYEVIRRLGHGGMGTVYLARDPGLDRLLAVKILSDLMVEDEVIQRFLREARAAGNLRHQNIITVYDTGQHEQQPFMAMEYVDGVSFAEIIRSRQPLPLADKVSYLEQVCAGLHHAHSQGIVHRDIKPANLMVDRRQVVRILDFGIARVEGSGMTRDGALIGTLNYMSPEQMLGKPVDHRSDIFGFGAVAYELIAYERAFPGSITDGLLHRLPSEPPRPLGELCPGLPEGLEAVILRALAKQPQDRFADLEEARLALRQVRRQLDPQLDVEPASGSRRGAASVSTPTPGGSAASSTERREFVERRAVQVAYHRDAARKALAAQDLDAAASACEDALTLDPGDHEAQQLLAEIEQARERRGAESKERQERDRAVRKHVADADLKFSRGDVESAADLLRQALALDPHNEAALALRSRIEQTSGGGAMATVVLPQSRPRTGSSSGARAQKSEAPPAVEHAEAPTHSTTTPQPEPAKPASRVGMLVAAAAAVAVLAAGIFWALSRDDSSPAPSATLADGSAAPDPLPQPPPDPPPSAAPAPEVSAAPPPAPAPAPSPAAAPAAAPAPAPSGSRGAAPATAAAPPDVRPAVRVDLGPIESALAAGDVARALSLLEALPDSSNAEVEGAARRVAERSMDFMAAAESAAGVYKAADLAPASFAAGAEAKTLAQRAFTREDYRQAGRQAVTATTGFRRAADEARAAADAARKAEEAARIAKRDETPAPRAEPANTAKPKEAAANTAPRLSIADSQGISDALNRFRKAYIGRDVNGIRRLITSIPDQQIKVWRSNFDTCRSVNVDFSGMRTLVAPEDPTAATVHVRSTYYCQPKIRAPELETAQDDVFTLRKVGDNWVIDRMGSLN